MEDYAHQTFVAPAVPPPPVQRAQHLQGFDLLRVTGIVLVTLQHALTLTGHADLTDWWGLNIGQLGVSIFLGLSAYLGGVSEAPATAWLKRRLLRIYPPYWLVLAASFLLTWIFRYKTFDAWQVVSQMLGTGLFTHPASLVNTPTWFISLLIVGYLGLFALKLTRHVAVVSAACSVAVIAYALVFGTRWPWFHLIVFALAASCAGSLPSRARPVGIFLIGLLVLGLTWMVPAFAYAATTLMVMVGSLMVPSVPRVVRIAAKYSYEYYLVHGVALVATTTFLPTHPVVAVLLGVAGAAAAAGLVQRVTARIAPRGA